MSTDAANVPEQGDRDRGSTGRDMERITFPIPEAQIDALDELVDVGVYPNRSEAIRDAVRQLVADAGGEAGD